MKSEPFPTPSEALQSLSTEIRILAPLGPERVSPCSVDSHRSPLPWISTLQSPIEKAEAGAGSAFVFRGLPIRELFACADRCWNGLGSGDQEEFGKDWMGSWRVGLDLSR
uniref:Uncharacterized protein n=1 Tax=Arundo donax TaxID=35708 RepID=A0A0A9FQK1_ARUDO